MTSYLIGLQLPSSIKHQLASLCYGLPFTEWVEEENFHILLRFMGRVNDQILEDVQKALANVAFLSFSIILQGVDIFQEKKGEGTLWTGISPQQPLIQLKNEIDRAVKKLPIVPNERTFKPHVSLGKYKRLPIHKLGEYLTIHSLFQSEPIVISSFTLFASQTTSKRTFYQEIENYTANPLHFAD